MGPPLNEVRLAGRVSGDPQERLLPGGDRLWTFRLVVERVQPRGRQRVDVLECVAWSSRTRRSVSRWGDGEEVEVTGSLRRRVFRVAGATSSRVEVEVSTTRLSRRAATS